MITMYIELKLTIVGSIILGFAQQSGQFPKPIQIFRGGGLSTKLHQVLLVQTKSRAAS